MATTKKATPAVKSAKPTAKAAKATVSTAKAAKAKAFDWSKNKRLTLNKQGEPAYYPSTEVSAPAKAQTLYVKDVRFLANVSQPHWIVEFFAITSYNADQFAALAKKGLATDRDIRYMQLNVYEPKPGDLPAPGEEVRATIVYRPKKDNPAVKILVVRKIAREKAVRGTDAKASLAERLGAKSVAQLKRASKPAAIEGKVPAKAPAKGKAAAKPAKSKTLKVKTQKAPAFTVAAQEV